ncbi:chromate transporter [Paenibacillus caui]|uniref:chromate transporter n=1 Tax=Paenibacillus caui TaxID=2873927 RepID=UPI001CA93B35|nr:chromate transporter [Paenibacillus caui]
MKHDYGDLCAAMLRTGLLGFGGGPSTIPLFRHEAVTRYAWMEDEEFGEVLAIANTLPGPIATKLAAYLGYRLKGTPGAVIAVLGHILPTCLAMVLLYSFIQFFSSSPLLRGMINAVTPVIAVMLGQMGYQFGEKAVKGLGIYAAAGFFLISFVLLELVKVHAAIVIVLFLAYGAFHYKLLANRKAAGAKKGERGL